MTPLDGGRIVAAIHPALWIVGLVLLVGLAIVAPNPILILILSSAARGVATLAASLDPTARRTTGHADAALVRIAYIVLAALLTLGMAATFVERDF